MNHINDYFKDSLKTDSSLSYFSSFKNNIYPLYSFKISKLEFLFKNIFKSDIRQFVVYFAVSF